MCDYWLEWFYAAQVVVAKNKTSKHQGHVEALEAVIQFQSGRIFKLHFVIDNGFRT